MMLDPHDPFEDPNADCWLKYICYVLLERHGGELRVPLSEMPTRDNVSSWKGGKAIMFESDKKIGTFRIIDTDGISQRN